MIEVFSKKIISAILAVFITFPVHFFILSKEETAIVWLLVLAVVIDSLTGIWCAITNKVFVSRRMGQPMARKVGLYGFALLTAFIVSKTSPILFWVFEYMAIYLVLSEVLSIFENLSLLGFKIPTKILSTVNQLFEKYKEGDKKAKEKILEKEVLS